LAATRTSRGCKQPLRSSAALWPLQPGAAGAAGGAAAARGSGGRRGRCARRATAAATAGAATARATSAAGARGDGATGAAAARVRADVVLAGLLLGVDRLHVLHHLAPDQRGEGASVDGQAAELGLHRGVGLRVADPDAGREVGGAAAEPGVAV